MRDTGCNCRRSNMMMTWLCFLFLCIWLQPLLLCLLRVLETTWMWPGWTVSHTHRPMRCTQRSTQWWSSWSTSWFLSASSLFITSTLLAHSSRAPMTCRGRSASTPRDRWGAVDRGVDDGWWGMDGWWMEGWWRNDRWMIDDDDRENITYVNLQIGEFFEQK